MTVRAIKEVFARHGSAEVVMSDNQGCSVSLQRRTISCISRAAPATLKQTGRRNTLYGPSRTFGKKDSDYSRALLAYRSTGCTGSHQLSCWWGETGVPLPQSTTKLGPMWPDLQAVRKKEEEGRRKQATNYNLRHRARPLPEPSAGQKVWITTERTTGAVVSSANTPRS